MMNLKKRKEDFLQEYIALCEKHGICIDWCWKNAEATEATLFLDGAPSYPGLFGNSFQDTVDELRASI